MNNESIKEILDKYLNSLISYPFQKKDKEYILDYITNLQQLYGKALNDLVHESHRKMELEQENERLKDELERLHNLLNSQAYKDLDDYKSRVEKADELLELKQLRYLNEPEYRICTLDLQEVREILQGGKDDSNLPNE